jgi:hypothetical protein
MILNMLAEKKITADEAAELLRALGPLTGPAIAGEAAGITYEDTADPRSAEPPADDGSAHLSRERVRPRDSEQGHSRSILEDFLSRLDIDWGNLPFAFGGEAYRFEEEHRGQFAAGGTIDLDLTARNGRVEVYAWDRPEWRAVIRKKVRASNQEQAQQRAQDILHFAATPSGINFEERTVGWGNTGVSIEVWVPQDRIYEARAKSSNGRVVLDGLRCAGVMARTANGKVGVRVTDCATAEVSTANGQVTFEGPAGKLSCHTANGSIRLYPVPKKAGMRADVHTANGSIKVWVPQDNSTGYDIEARTGFGGLEVELPGFSVVEYDRQFGRRQLRGHTTDFAGKERTMALTARTTNGSIRVMTRRAGDIWEDDERPREPEERAGRQPEPR